MIVDNGSLAQLVEHLPYKQNVGSSRLSGPTISDFRFITAKIFLKFQTANVGSIPITGKSIV